MDHDTSEHDRGPAAIPPEEGTLPDEEEPDPAPERDELVPTRSGEQNELGQAVGADNIRDGRVGGVMGPPLGTQGQGQGG